VDADGAVRAKTEAKVLPFRGAA